MAEVVGHSETRVIAGGMVIVPGAAGGMTDMLMMIFPLMMLGMVMPMVTEGMQGDEAESIAV